MDHIKVSIIVPAYNVEEYIERTLNSIISQTFKYFELILVNDGSTDNTLKIIEETLLNSDINYKIINKQNGGVSAARNAGIMAAKGDYLFFLDGDDFIKDTCLEKLFNALINNNCDAAYTNYIKVSDNGKKMDIIPKIDLPETSPPEYLMKLEATMAITFSFCQMMYNKSILMNNKLFFSPELKYGEDTEFALKFLTHINRVAYVPEEMIFYVQRGDSATNKSLFNRYDFIDVLDTIKEYYKFNNISENVLNLIDTYRIPKSIWGNTIFLFDTEINHKDVICELKRRKLINRLNLFQPVNKKDYIFIGKVKLFTAFPNLYYFIRNLIRNH